ncbi:MAG: hypothetical protein DRJ32_06865 [Thermoprotei archaeon]|nr:MAG: hypothetical protein DRJ32_06865 [Thermoprotei archaeon]
MRITDYFYLSFASLSERKGRTIGAIIGVIIAVVALSMALGIGESFQAVFKEELGKSLAANSVYVVGSSLTDVDLMYFREIPGVKDVFGVALRSALIVDPSGSKSVMIVAMDPDKIPIYLGLNSLDDLLVEGLGAPEGLGVIVGSDIWRDPQTGDKLRNIGESLTLTIKGRSSRQFTVFIAGLAKSVGGFRGPTFNPDIMIFMDPEAFFTYVSRRKVYTFAVVVIEDVGMLEYIETELRALAPPGARVFSPIAMVQQVNVFVSSLQMILALISSVGIGVTALWVFDSMTISVVHRTREIGILKAIGFKSIDILLLFLMEAIYISLIGSFIGIGISLILANTFAIPVFRYRMKAMITPTIILLSIVLPTLANLVASIIPAKKAASLDPVRALRYE